MERGNSERSVIIEAENLCKEVRRPGGGALTILDHISFRVRKAESVAIVGVSGAGKSTLLGLLAGLERPSGGRVLLEGRDLGELDENELARLRAGRVGFVFQTFQLLPSMTALENVILPLELAGAPRSRETAAAELERVGLGARLRHYPAQLSGGEQQRVAIARAYASQPHILFADEPTGNLDQRTARQVMDLLFRLNEEHGATLVLVSHDNALAARCNRILPLREGRLAAEDLPAAPAAVPAVAGTLPGA
ncbi:MAG: ABC transporter ATP-binding protein [Gammaproteobacteria bacterium]|nr:ABC transporter ATP-binding protein [Gammaproteobacteria bacterium]MDD9863470.1 ABC transporter ATP-binding protein [Gammaproteobacteria bacterium]